MNLANVSAVADISSLCELDDVTIYEVGSRLDAAFEEDGSLRPVAESDEASSGDGAGSDSKEEHEWELHIAVGPRRVECRARLLVRARGARYLVDAGVRYKGSHQLDEVPRETIFRFVETAALPTLLPFIRSEIHQGAAKIGANSKVFRSLSDEVLHQVLADAFREGDDGAQK
ncbi:MAG: hypothetical protein LC808_09665 [Actinobacteria bacterium]|nr:hypothetical protein [Actinomycetota bacterium]